MEHLQHSPDYSTYRFKETPYGIITKGRFYFIYYHLNT